MALWHFMLNFALMNILLIGSGGRESAIAWSLSQSPELGELFIAPGNPGTLAYGNNVSVDWRQFVAMKDFCMNNRIDMVIVGPEEPLCKGLGDQFATDEDLASILFIGPSAKGAQLEGSKDFAKSFMMQHNIPTAAYRTFNANELEAAVDYLATVDGPYVLKADGLAAGKGVVILDTLAEAQQEMRSMLGDAKFGAASSRVVVEEFLAGMEFSVFAVTDGKSAVILPEAKDYKRIGEGDQGPNTGGMGAVSPVPLFDEAMQKQVMSRIIEPTIEGLAKDGLPYKGFLFFGLIDVGGEAMVIEYNCRMGDPETEVVMARLDEDVLPILRDAGNGKLTNRVARQSKQSAATVMMVSEGYPGSYPKGLPISGLDQASEHAIVFQAGTTLKDEELCTAGGRVLCVTGVGNNMASALGKAYQAVASITFDGANHRKDIGQDIL